MTTLEAVIAIILAVLGSNGLFALIQYFISRHDKKNNQNKEIEARLDKLDEKQIVAEKDSCRTQLLILMVDYPDETGEIMRIAKHYFDDLSGDWYLTSLFKQYLHKKDLPDPVWFNSKEDQK